MASDHRRRRSRGASLSSAPSGAPPVLATGASPPAECPPETREFVDTLGLNYISVTVALHPGGIQIGGPSTDVYILENEIEGGSRNGITLGSFQLSTPTATTPATGPESCGIIDGCCTVTLQPPIQRTTAAAASSPVASSSTFRFIATASATWVCAESARSGSSTCGTTLEIITIVGLKITSNGISRTLLRDLAPLDQSKTSLFGYGAICVPDVQGLTIYDNTITDFGAQPGVAGCGIFVLHGEIAGHQPQSDSRDARLEEGRQHRPVHPRPFTAGS